MRDARPARRRGRRPAGSDTRADILAAAEQEFAESGYEGASLRAIARRAGVDAALVHHYFADKADLFLETVRAPARPDRLVAAVLAGPRDRVGELLVRTVLETLDEPSAQPRMIQLVRTALGHEFAARALRQFVVRELLHRVATAIGGPDAELRAALAGSQLVGLIILRYGLRVEPLASASRDEVVARVGQVVQRHLVPDGGSQ